MALTKKLADFSRALDRLNESFQKAKEHKDDEEFSFFRDSTIQRFEFTLEIAWKCIKSYLYETEGIECRSPKSCIREFAPIAQLSPEETIELLGMIDDRNLATHTYHESLADEIYRRIGAYLDLLHRIRQRLCA